jgi:hypothetical protein
MGDIRRDRFVEMAERDDLERGERTFTWPLLGALYGSVVIVAVVGILASGAGRSFEDEVDAPARTLVAAPVVAFAVALFLASIMALIVPGRRRASMRAAEIFAWLIPAWLVMCAMGIGAVAFALHHAE